MDMRLDAATEAHIDTLIRRMKPDHIRELAWFDHSPTTGVKASYRNSRAAAAAMAGDTLLFVAGVAERPFTPEADAIWYLATVDFDRHVRAALRMTRLLFDVEAWKYTKTGRLEQFLPPAYTAGIRFLEWLGWTRGGVTSMGRRQAVHMHFDRPAAEEA